ncbi:putative serine/threonine-protein kinase clkA [Vespula maculifrons]|uniref:Serine/threonine-protein kinase clkA n=1 Tax=Vespula maculifrons TaxID=7453 RepID=A0ABD2CFW2_VESMC
MMSRENRRGSSRVRVKCVEEFRLMSVKRRGVVQTLFPTSPSSEPEKSLAESAVSTANMLTDNFAMPHCTTNFAWYLGKFLIGFTGMLILYMSFLKDKEYPYKPGMREPLAGKKSQNNNTCSTGDQINVNATKQCKHKSMAAHGTKIGENVVGKKNVIRRRSHRNISLRTTMVFSCVNVQMFIT